MISPEWVQWYYWMCDDLQPYYPNVPSSESHFDLESITLDRLKKCHCLSLIIGQSHDNRSSCPSFTRWKRAFLRVDENQEQLSAFCRPSTYETDGFITNEKEEENQMTDQCRELILWIWYRMQQLKEVDLRKRFDDQNIIDD